jgi:hypothetical protein
MRCAVCGSEVHLIESAKKNIGSGQSYEPDASRCPVCDEREQQPVFDAEPARASPTGWSSSQSAVPIAPSIPAASVVADLDSYLDEIETLLRRAKQMVKEPVSRSEPVVGLTDDGNNSSDR